MVMVGMRLETSPGHYLVDNDILNGVVIMILFTCVISSVITERAAKRIVLDNNTRTLHEHEQDDEKILLPVKYPDLAETLLSVAIMMRNPKLNRGLVALNVVYDDIHRQDNQEKGRRLLEKLEKAASAADVRMQTQVTPRRSSWDSISTRRFHPSSGENSRKASTTDSTGRLSSSG